MNQETTNAEKTYRTALSVWAALLLSQVMFIVMLFFIKPELFRFDFSRPLLGDNAMAVGLIMLLCINNVVLSFVFRRKYLRQAEAIQSPQQAQTAIVVGCAMAESVSLFGMVLAFAFDYPYFFIFFILGIGTTLLHFPRREEIHAASYRRSV